MFCRCSKEKRLGKIFNPISRNTLLVAFDHGFEHGPVKYDKVNMNPKRVLKIALEGFAEGLIVHAGAARQIKDLIPKEMALIVKVTGKTNLTDNRVQSIVTSVKEAKKLGADAIAATIYIGSYYEHFMLQNISKIKADCIKYKMPLIGFVYPRVDERQKNDPELVRYAGRVGAELGFDLVKTYYTGDKKSFSSAVKDCFVPLACAGGDMKKEKQFLKNVKDIMESGARGLIVGRNVWMNKKPGPTLRKVNDIVHKKVKK